VLIGDPDLVVADEPTALLDLANTRRIRRHLLDELSQQLVIATHDMRIAAQCDIVLRFENGGLHDQGEPAAVIHRYERDHA
jgi:biotin transport system ATP-binding protein